MRNKTLFSFGGFNRHLAILVVGLISLGSAQASQHANNDFSLRTMISTSDLDKQIESIPALVIQQQIGAQDIQISVREVPEATHEDAIRIIREYQSQENLVISTDQKLISEEVLIKKSARSSKPMRLIPFGPLVKVKSKFQDFLNSHQEQVQLSFRKDKIGLTIATFVAGYDSYLWIHASSLEFHQKSALVMFNLLLYSTFGVNKELWASIAKPIKNKLLSGLDQFIPQGEYFDYSKILVSQFLSNLVISSLVQTSRVTLLSVDHLFQSMQSSPFWISSLQTAALATMTQFAWSELSASVDFGLYPKTKIMLRRLTDFRVLLLSQLASISMVLQPETYGQWPIITLITHGGLGIFALLSAQKVIHFIENNRAIDVIYRQNQKVEEFLENLNFTSYRRAACDALF